VSRLRLAAAIADALESSSFHLTVTEVDRNWNLPIQAGFSACVTILKEGHRIRGNNAGRSIEVAIIEDQARCEKA
jgi:hypothetical protein